MSTPLEFAIGACTIGSSMPNRSSNRVSGKLFAMIPDPEIHFGAIPEDLAILLAQQRS